MIRSLLCLILGHRMYCDDIAGGTVFECCDRCNYTKLLADYSGTLECESVPISPAIQAAVAAILKPKTHR